MSLRREPEGVGRFWPGRSCSEVISIFRLHAAEIRVGSFLGTVPKGPYENILGFNLIFAVLALQNKNLTLSVLLKHFLCFELVHCD